MKDILHNLTITALAEARAAAKADTNLSRDEAFLGHLATNLMKLPQFAGCEHEEKRTTGHERLYDICIFRRKDLTEKWSGDVREIAELAAAIEVENCQGPRKCFQDLWKVVFSAAKYRFFFGGYLIGNDDRFTKEQQRIERLKVIGAHFNGKEKDLYYIYYPNPSEWDSTLYDRGFELSVWSYQL